MSIPTPRYQIGDIVWHPGTQDATEQLPCPDCLGSRTWKVTTPAGTELTASCLRCAPRGYLRSSGGEDIPSLMVRKSVPHVRRLTIGSVRIDTNDAEHPVSYMCCETGVGSGSIYYEQSLFPTEEEAASDAAETAALQTQKLTAQPKQIGARKLGELTVELAGRATDWNSVYQAWDVARWHRETLDEILNEKDGPATVADIREYVETRQNELRRYEFIDRHPFEALLVAAHASTDPFVVEVAARIGGKLPSGDGETSEATDEPMSAV